MRLARLTAAIALAPAAAGVGLWGCGHNAASRSAASAPSHAATPPTSPPTPPGAAKRRYLEHFRQDCRSAGQLGKATESLIGSLSAQIARGNLAAVTELNLFLQRLAATYQAGLRSTRALGSPPGPDSADGRAYLDDTQRMIGSIRAMGAAVGRLDASGLHAAESRLQAATAAAGTASRRYGFPTCRGRPSGGAPPLPSVSSGAPA